VVADRFSLSTAFIGTGVGFGLAMLVLIVLWGRVWEVKTVA
jgi:hypothetical protein